MEEDMIMPVSTQGDALGYYGRRLQRPTSSNHWKRALLNLPIIGTSLDCAAAAALCLVFRYPHAKAAEHRRSPYSPNIIAHVSLRQTRSLLRELRANTSGGEFGTFINC